MGVGKEKHKSPDQVGMRTQKRKEPHPTPREASWLQKSRNEWLKSGNGNNKFFHTSTLIRRRRNMIETL